MKQLEINVAETCKRLPLALFLTELTQYFTKVDIAGAEYEKKERT